MLGCSANNGNQMPDSERCFEGWRGRMMHDSEFGGMQRDAIAACPQRLLSTSIGRHRTLLRSMATLPVDTLDGLDMGQK